VSNVTRILLNEPVSDFIAYEATIDQAYHVLNLAVDIAEQQGRSLQLAEALHAVQIMPQQIRGGEHWLS
jgi:hypothetical protein